mmetsp:Transcript_3041/g.7445  ORF Transcript_3041/g.7445 Transcript_3041/m.7445 type:complete len:396 (-) Transcript_3041:474-1661(-)
MSAKIAAKRGGSICALRPRGADGTDYSHRLCRACGNAKAKEVSSPCSLMMLARQPNLVVEFATSKRTERARIAFHALKDTLASSCQATQVVEVEQDRAGNDGRARVSLKQPRPVSASKKGLSRELSAAEIERRRKISEAKRRNWQNPEYKCKMSATLRGKASEAMTLKWQCEDYSLRVSEGRKGITAWNKGKRLTSEHKKNVSEAKKGSRHSKDTREKMSRSQKRRYAAARVLQAVDKVVQTTNPTAESSVEDKLKNGLMKQYKGMLHAYRTVEAEIKPWVEQFERENGRKPKLSDIRATNISWLIEKYKKYIFARQQLLLQIPSIRFQLDHPKVDQKAGQPRYALMQKDKVPRRRESDKTQEWSSRMDKIASNTTNPRVREAVRLAIDYKKASV